MQIAPSTLSSLFKHIPFQKLDIHSKYCFSLILMSRLWRASKSSIYIYIYIYILTRRLSYIYPQSTISERRVPLIPHLYVRVPPPRRPRPASSWPWGLGLGSLSLGDGFLFLLALGQLSAGGWGLGRGRSKLAFLVEEAPGCLDKERKL